MFTILVIVLVKLVSFCPNTETSIMLYYKLRIQLWIKTWHTSLGTQRCQCCLKLLRPFTRTWTIFPTQLRILKPSYEHSRGSPELPNQSLRQIGPGVSNLWSEKQTNKQTNKQKQANRDYNFIYIDTIRIQSCFFTSRLMVALKFILSLLKTKKI